LKRVISVLLALILAVAVPGAAYAANTGETSFEESNDFDYESYWRDIVSENRVSMGGTEEGLAVMVNGRYISFPDARPEYCLGKTMVPLRAFVEAQGGQVKYDPPTKLVTAVLNGVGMNLKAGSTEVAAVKNGEAFSFNLDCAPYVKNGTTYVPVRGICELAGYDVFWDSDYETAVILNRSSIVSEIDKNYSVINKVFTIGSGRDAEKTYKAAMDLLISYTDLTPDGSGRTVDVTMNIDAIQNGLNQKITLTADLGKLIAFLGELAADDPGFYADEEALKIFESMSNLSMDMILNLDEECLYIKSNIFKSLGMVADENTWILFGSEYMGAITDIYSQLYGEDWYSYLSSAEYTLGSLIYDISCASANVFTYANIMDAANSIAVLSDSMFTKSGNTWKLNMNLESCEAFLAAIYGEDYTEYDAEDFRDTFEEFNISLNITEINGKVSASGELALQEKADTEYPSPIQELRISFSLSEESVKLKLEIQENDVMNLVIEYNGVVSETNEPVPKAPPEGSTVIAIEDIYGSLYEPDSASSDLAMAFKS
jgi:hypothetical protein